MAQSPVVLAGRNMRRAGDRFFSSTVVKAYPESGKWCGSPFAREDEAGGPVWPVAIHLVSVTAEALLCVSSAGLFIQNA